MRICLPYILTSEDRSLFNSEYGQTLLTIALMLEEIGHEVSLHCCSDMIWWDDSPSLSLKFYNRGETQFDLLIDVGALISPTVRNALCKRTIAFLYDAVLFNELQQFAYVNDSVKRHLEKGSVYEIWTWDCLTEERHIPCLESILHCPVRRLPFIWSSSIIKSILNDCGECNITDDACNITPNKYMIYENNLDNTSCTAFPLACLNINGIVVESCNVYSTGNRYFTQNIITNLAYTPTFQQYADCKELLNINRDHILISHTRFRTIQLHTILLAWLGIPFVHNSPVLKDAGFTLNYYSGNSIKECHAAISAVTDTQNYHLNTKQILETAWSLDKGILQWSDAMSRVEPIKVQIPLIISFSDMWEGFDATDNFFLDLLRSRSLQYSYISGHKGICIDSALHICGPFGSEWTTLKRNIPIVFFSGESWIRNETLEKSSINLFLTHDLTEDDRHLRLPLWILFLQVFGGEGKPGRNPNGMPLALATTSNTVDWLDRDRFCAFVVSNPNNTIRNAAFMALDQYEDIDSGGAFMNTIGGPIEHVYAGGGGGDAAKCRFLRERKFCLCYENSSAPGYVTEKLLHAKLAGCIPIYWGAEAAVQDFDPRGFINMCGKAATDVVHCVDEVYNNTEQCKYMSQLPALGEKELNAMWACIDRVGIALERLLTKEIVVQHKDEMICRAEMNLDPIFVSFATKKFIGSICHGLSTIKSIRDRAPKIHYILYIGDDCGEDETVPLLNDYPWIEIRKLPTGTNPANEDFTDFWNHRHFGWKLWIYNEIIRDPAFKDRILVYSDAGAQWLHPYPEMFKAAWDTGVCFVVDKQINLHWCSPTMVSQMNITDAELDGQQILGGIMALRGGHAGACEFFARCYTHGLNQKILCGRRLLRVLSSGQPTGHRHDQSIMSIERIRSGMQFGTVPVNKATCTESLRRTVLRSIPIYLHRGSFLSNSYPLPRVGDIWMVNLDRRNDRCISWAQEYPELATITQRLSAIDGKEIQLTDAITKLFAKNDFHWKKPIVGCALSHILLWAQLACEGPDVNSYLILEDDMRFFKKEGWNDTLDSALVNLPADTELAYFGGILPGNRNVYNSAIRSVNSMWSVITPNPYFSKEPMPIFHFCTYSYYLTKGGALKLLHALLDGIGCFTSIDNFMGHYAMNLKKYVLTEPIIGCFQEDDSAYVNSDFDNFKRIDTFDSDIWNNYEVFLNEDITRYGDSKLVSLYPAICDVLRQTPSNIETCTLLSPGSYCRMLVNDGRSSECDIVQTYMKGLNTQMQDPSKIEFIDRHTVIIYKEAACNNIIDTINKLKTVIQCKGTLDKNYAIACNISKLYWIDSLDNIKDEIAHIRTTGCIPIYMRKKDDNSIWAEIKARIPLVELIDCDAVIRFIQVLISSPAKGEMYRRGLVAASALAAISVAEGIL